MKLDISKWLIAMLTRKKMDNSLSSGDFWGLRICKTKRGTRSAFAAKNKYSDGTTLVRTNSWRQTNWSKIWFDNFGECEAVISIRLFTKLQQCRGRRFFQVSTKCSIECNIPKVPCGKLTNGKNRYSIAERTSPGRTRWLTLELTCC